jgi:glycosyltransferase involved in cell wall biosynthesis
VRNLRAAAVVTSASEAMARVVRSLDPAARVVVVPFGVDTGKFRPPAGSGPRPERIVGTVKGLDPVYGIDLLLHAFAALRGARDSAPPTRLVIAGEGTARAALQTLARSLGLEGLVEFLGDVAHARVPALLGSFSVYVALSRRESFGVGVAEASACGVPVVVSDVGGLPEVVEAGVTGEIVPTEDPAAAAGAIRRLLEDPVRASAMGRAGRERIQRRFEWSACVDRMLAVYADACGASTPPAPGVTSVAGAN